MKNARILAMASLLLPSMAGAAQAAPSYDKYLEGLVVHQYLEYCVVNWATTCGHDVRAAIPRGGNAWFRIPSNQKGAAVKNDAARIMREEGYPAASYEGMDRRESTLDKYKIANWIVSNPKETFLIVHKRWAAVGKITDGLVMEAIEGLNVEYLALPLHVYVSPEDHVKVVTAVAKKKSDTAIELYERLSREGKL